MNHKRKTLTNCAVSNYKMLIKGQHQENKQAITWEKIFTVHISDKYIVSRTYKETL